MTICECVCGGGCSEIQENNVGIILMGVNTISRFSHSSVQTNWHRIHALHYEIQLNRDFPFIEPLH